MLIESQLIAEMIKGLIDDGPFDDPKMQAYKGMEVLLLMARDKRFDRINTASMLDKLEQIEQAGLDFQTSLREVWRILLT